MMPERDLGRVYGMCACGAVCNPVHLLMGEGAAGEGGGTKRDRNSDLRRGRGRGSS